MFKTFYLHCEMENFILIEYHLYCLVIRIENQHNKCSKLKTNIN